MYPFIVTAALVLAMSTAPRADVRPGDGERLAAAARAVQEIRDEIPPEHWTRARCVVVIPELKRAVFILGGEHGKGVMSCRAGDQWSAPVFVALAKGSSSFQAAADELDLVLLVMNDQGVQRLLQTKVDLGAGASVAPGPIGAPSAAAALGTPIARRGAAGTGAAITTEILSYSRAKGLLTGIDISGAVLGPDDDANVGVYGKGATPRTILASREMSAPLPAAPFLKALRAAGSATAAATGGVARAAAGTNQAVSAPVTARPTTTPTTDDDLRARVVDIEQTLDRILADTTPATVGTSGTIDAPPARGSVTVDRARLLQVREQLEALLATLNHR